MTWTPDTPPFAAWDVLGFDRQRVTEAGARRVTEDGLTIRIIERYRVAWAADPAPSAAWITTG